MKRLRCQKRPPGNENGFTLLEILIAITIFAIGMLAVASMQISGIHGNATAIVLTGGAAWGADKAEELVARSYDHADLNSGAHGPETDDTGRYTISWNVTDDRPINNVKTVLVTVTWQDRGNNKSLVLNYYKADI